MYNHTNLQLMLVIAAFLNVIALFFHIWFEEVHKTRQLNVFSRLLEVLDRQNSLSEKIASLLATWQARDTKMSEFIYEISELQTMTPALKDQLRSIVTEVDKTYG